MGDKVRLGIVGCGEIAGYAAWAARLSARLGGHLHPAAACDPNPQRVEQYARRHHIPRVFTEYEALLASGVEAVYLAVPHHLHAGMLEAAIRAGLPVLVEKPLTRTLAEGIAMAGLVEQCGAVAAVNYQYRYDSGCYALARAVQRGELGRVHSVRINVPWRREAGYFTGSAWHRSLATAGGGTLITQGSHFLDVVLWALAGTPGGRPVSAVGYTARRRFHDVEVEDLAHGILEMTDGALVQITSSMAASHEQAVTIEVYGETATAVYTDRPLPHVRFSGRPVRREKPPITGVHALQRSLEAFGRWVRGGEAHLVPVREALPVLAAVEAVYRSAVSGRREVVEAV